MMDMKAGIYFCRNIRKYNGFNLCYPHVQDAFAYVQEIMHWFCAIRAAKLKIMREMFPERPLEMVSNIAAHYHSQACTSFMLSYY